MKPEGEGAFAQLVLSLHSAAWISLGKVSNPLTGKMEKDLAATRQTIKVLEMLKEKTLGNLGEDESRLIAGCISTLQMGYFEEVGAEKSDGGARESS